MRICFLFNHDQVHQVAHSLPIALALATSGSDNQVVVATTSARLSEEVRRLSDGAVGRTVPLVQLGLRRFFSKAAARLLDRIFPIGKILIYKDNLDFFRTIDMVVVTEKTSLILKTRLRLKHLKIVHTRHGAGDRAIGFDKASALFDHVLVSGRKVADRLKAEASLSENRLSIVGYPKFDLMPSPTTILRDKGRPVVLYNPHPSPHLSSWYAWGRQVLDWFVENNEYFLIFAPHIMLFQRKFVFSVDKLRVDRPGRIAARYLEAENIHVDVGSRALTTMEYTDRADVYLGDASSQLYEFLKTPRPCVHLNSHGVAYENDTNYAHWRAGPVVNSMAEFGSALRTSIERHQSHYRRTQEELFRYTFDLTREPSSVRAARAIARIAGEDVDAFSPRDLRAAI